MDVMVGILITVKVSMLVVVPPAFVKLIFPVIAVCGTVITTALSVAETIGATTLPNFTDVGLLRLVPEIVTLSPAIPFVELKPVIFGVILNIDRLVPAPALFITLIFPVVVPAGRVNLIDVA